jgi:Concanavalin A-like lectin/glucanases superfamily/Divergent InlB B-repeat domain/Immunoglobulin I-set domain
MNFVYDPCGNLNTQAAGNLVAPKITGQPLQQVATPGDVATFSVVLADARAVAFQWKFDGADIPGATGDSLPLTNVNTANEGQYSVVVTNSMGSVTSTPAPLTVRSNPTVDTSTPPRLLVYSDPGGSVNVTPLKPNYTLGETVTLTATPLADSVFVDWVVGFSSQSGATQTLTMDGDKVARARFGSNIPRLIAFSGVGGSVTVTPMKRGYNPEEMVTLTATPFAPSEFSGWIGDLSGSSNPATLTMNGNKKVGARFASAAPLPPGLVASWRGETDASDSIGGNHGAFFAGLIGQPPSITMAGKVGSAFEFDGTVHVRVPDSPALRPAQITVEAWVFPTGTGAGLQTIIARGSSTNEDDTWALVLVNRMPQFSSQGNHAVQGPFAIALNQWTHLATSFDGSVTRIYVNGVQVHTRLDPGILVYDPVDLPMTIGSDWASNQSSSRFLGRIDEVSLYNRALTGDEIVSIYHADFVGKDFDLPYFTSPAHLPDASGGVTYSHQCSTVLGSAPVTFSLSKGTLPPGITISPAGLISGISTIAGTFDFAILATDAAGRTNEQSCLLQVL